LLGAETRIKTIAAVHSQCRCPVKSAALALKRILPVAPNQRTSPDRPDWAASCHSVDIANSAFSSAIDNTRHYRPRTGARISPNWDDKEKGRDSRSLWAALRAASLAHAGR
jgi:hypothetical protein